MPDNILSNSNASLEVNTLSCPWRTAGTPRRAKASWIKLPCRWVGTNTAISPPLILRSCPAPTIRAMPADAKFNKRTISVTVASAARLLAISLLSGFPSDGMSAKLKALEPSPFTIKLGLALVAAWTGWYLISPIRKGWGERRNKAFTASISWGDERWFTAKVYWFAACHRACK